jgi:hypothetical protein
MPRRFTIALLSVAFIVAAAMLASAHIVEVTGTIVERTAELIDVKTASGEIVTVKIESNTTVMRNKRVVDAAELKVGVRVEAQTLDDPSADLVAYLVTILPAK